MLCLLQMSRRGTFTYQWSLGPSFEAESQAPFFPRKEGCRVAELLLSRPSKRQGGSKPTEGLGRASPLAGNWPSEW